MAQSVESPTVGFGSGRDLGVVRSSPELGTVLCGESLAIPSSPLPSRPFSLSEIKNKVKHLREKKQQQPLEQAFAEVSLGLDGFGASLSPAQTFSEHNNCTVDYYYSATERTKP